MQFDEYFWGERNNGFDVLLNNLKHGADSSKEIFDFLKESCTIEDVYAKQLSRLAKSCSTYSSKGSFGPLWVPVRTLCEKLSNLHQQLVMTWNELMREVHKYSEQRLKQHKQVKDEESATQEAVQTFQQTVQLLLKTKEAYYARCSERDKLKRDSASLKDLEKAEARCKKAGEDYRHMIDKYAVARNDFETKMVESCKKFRLYEEAHLKQMKEFVEKYASTWRNQHAVLGQMHDEFRVVTDDLSVDKLLEKFVSKKATGQERPGSIMFEEFDPSAVTLHAKTPDADRLFATAIADKNKSDTGERDSPQLGSQTTNAQVKSQPNSSSSILDRTIPLRSSAPWLFPGRKKKAKKQEKGDGSEGAKTPVAEIDDEGYTVRPTDSRGPDDGAEKDSSGSSEDEESLEGSLGRGKIKVEIRPANATPDLTSPNTNTDLLNVALGLRLSPTLASGRRSTPPVDSKMRKSVSASETLHAGQQPMRSYEIDLFSSSDQLNNGPVVPPRKDSAVLLNSTSSRSISNDNRLSNHSSSSAIVSPYQWLNPITQRMTDDIPVAMMIKETVSAHFHLDSDSVRPRVVGEVAMSLPTSLFSNSDSLSMLPPLTFTLRGIHVLDVVLHNRDIVTLQASQGDLLSRVFTVDMSAIQSRALSSSSSDDLKFVNVDLIKYQVRREQVTIPPLRLSSTWHTVGSRHECSVTYEGMAATLTDVKVMVRVSDARNHFFSSMMSGGGGNLTLSSLEMKATPSAECLPSGDTAVWDVGVVEGDSGVSGCVSATFTSLRPLTEHTAVTFMSDGATLSQVVDCELNTRAYRLAQLKKCFVAGKYTVESVKK